jgi:ATP/maltotriose-dependent transcriptional regulator MalT
LGKDFDRAKVSARYSLALELQRRSYFAHARMWALSAAVFEAELGRPTYLVQSYAAQLWERVDPALAARLAEKALATAEEWSPASRLMCILVLARIAARVGRPEELAERILQVEASLAATKPSWPFRAEIEGLLAELRGSLAKRT